MKTNNYTEQYNSPKWQKKRLEILELHNFKCDECDNKEEKQLHVHHRFYLKDRKVWEYDNDVFQVLCETHHTKVHENKHKIMELNEHYFHIINFIKKFDDPEQIFSYLLLDILAFCDYNKKENLIHDIHSILHDSQYSVNYFLSQIDQIKSMNYYNYRITNLEKHIDWLCKEVNVKNDFLPF